MLASPSSRVHLRANDVEKQVHGHSRAGQAASALPCCVSRLPPRHQIPLWGVCTQAAPHPHVTGLPAVHVLSSNFGEFPQNHSRETYQIWSGSPGLLGWITFLAPLSTHLWSPRNRCSHSVPGLPYTTTQLPSPRGHSGPCLVSPWVPGTMDLGLQASGGICPGSSEAPTVPITPYPLQTL